jgi:hypothetical protein
MTPAAMTPAGRVKTKAGAPRTAANKSAGHAPRLRVRPTPKVPRRVSGPLRGRTPARARSASAPSVWTRATQQAGAFVRALPDQALLDRLVRGRMWIPLLGVMLAGIVAMQVEVLKLGASIGRSIERGTALQSRNEQLRDTVASLADDQRIERLAAGMGMVMAPPTGVGFLSASAGANVQGAIANIHAPNSQAFMSLLSSNGAVTALANTSTPGTTGAPTSSTPAVTSVSPSVSTAPSATTTSGSTSGSRASVSSPAQAGGTSGIQAPSQTSSPTTHGAPAATQPTAGGSTGTTGGAGVP